MKKIAVVGAGVNGLSVACKLAEKFYNDAQITLISDETSPNTTGNKQLSSYLVSLNRPN